MSELLAPHAVAAAGARHGQRARRIGDGAVVVECSKVVEDGRRVMVLLIPRLLRIDVRWSPDALKVHTREFTPWPARWTSQQRDTTIVLDVDFPDLPAPLSGQARVTARERPGGGSALVEARILLGRP